MRLSKREQIAAVAAIIRDAGGKIVGRTRLQKIAYLLDVAGFGDGFYFVYKHYGPYSEVVAEAARVGALFGDLTEEECQAEWGGYYSIYAVKDAPDDAVPAERRELARQAARAGAVVLELAATAVFLSLSRDGYDDPWAEVKRRKPIKSSGGRLDQAKELLRELKKVEVPSPLPDIV
ncbi:MAG: hypothetical protein GDA52_03065 [Rhodobacteraceae bacterium]|nr:hypothetical protein [Paracoccaceae bacterium]